MRKTRVKWLKKHFGPRLDEENPKGDFRLVKKWWTKLPTPEKQDLSNKVDKIKNIDSEIFH